MAPAQQTLIVLVVVTVMIMAQDHGNDISTGKWFTQVIKLTTCSAAADILRQKLTDRQEACCKMAAVLTCYVDIVHSSSKPASRVAAEVAVGQPPRGQRPEHCTSKSGG